MLLRAAAAGGAGRIEAGYQQHWSQQWLELRFDGRPLTDEEHLRPFDAIFGEGAGPRARFLAAGLLTLCRRSYRPVEVTSGEGANRRLVRILLDGEDQVLPPQDHGSGTLIRAAATEEMGFAVMNLDDGCQLLPARLTLRDRKLPRFNPRGPGLWFEEDGARGWIGLPPFIDTETTRLRLYHYGVATESRLEKLPLSQAEVWVNDDRAELDLSGNMVAGERYRRLVAIISGQVLRLVRKLAKGQARRLAEAWKILESDPLARACWRRRCDWGPGRNPESLTFNEGLRTLRGGVERQRRLAQVLWTTHATLWLRDLVERHVAKRGRGLPADLAEALAEVPIFFGKTGTRHSFAQLAPASFSNSDRLWFASPREKKVYQRLFGTT